MRFDAIEMNGVLKTSQGANIASASTVDLATATGNSVTITGTAAITALGTVTAGAQFTLTFNGILTLTYNGTSLILPTGANIVTAAGDVAVMESLGSGNWRCIDYQRADGSALVGAPSSLAATLGVGNETSGNDIIVSDSDKIVLEKSTQPDVTIENGGGVLQIEGGILATFDDGGGNSGTFASDRIVEFLGTFSGTTQSMSIGNPGGSPGGLGFTTTDETDTQDIILRPDGFTAPLNYQPGQTFTQPYQIVNKEYVDSTGVQSVSGLTVDNTVPTAPVINPVHSFFNGVPGAGQDSTQGYVAGQSRVVDYNTQIEYLCIDDTSSAAIWIPLQGSFTPINVTTPDNYITDPVMSDVIYYCVGDKITMQGSFECGSDPSLFSGNAGIEFEFPNTFRASAGVFGLINMRNKIVQYDSEIVDLSIESASSVIQIFISPDSGSSPAFSSKSFDFQITFPTIYQAPS